MSLRLGAFVGEPEPEREPVDIWKKMVTGEDINTRHFYFHAITGPRGAQSTFKIEEFATKHGLNKSPFSFEDYCGTP